MRYKKLASLCILSAPPYFPRVTQSQSEALITSELTSTPLTAITLTHILPKHPALPTMASVVSRATTGLPAAEFSTVRGARMDASLLDPKLFAKSQPKSRARSAASQNSSDADTVEPGKRRGEIAPAVAELHADPRRQAVLADIDAPTVGSLRDLGSNWQRLEQMSPFVAEGSVKTYRASGMRPEGSDAQSLLFTNKELRDMLSVG